MNRFRFTLLALTTVATLGVGAISTSPAYAHDNRAHSLSGPNGACQYYNPSTPGRVVGSTVVSTNRRVTGQANLSVDARVPNGYYTVGIADLSYLDNGNVGGCAISWILQDASNPLGAFKQFVARRGKLSLCGSVTLPSGSRTVQVIILPTKSSLTTDAYVTAQAFTLAVA